jgi:splicing factor 3A subunit 1
MDVDAMEGPRPPRSEPIIKPPPLPPSGPGSSAQIRRGYDPKAPKPAPPPLVPEKFLISPITGERVPASAMAEHMKINLLDPRWKEQRDRAMSERKTQEEVYAEGNIHKATIYVFHL